MSEDMGVPNHFPLEYRLCLEPEGVHFSIVEETLRQKNPGYSEPFHYIDSRHRKVRYYNTETKHFDTPDWDYIPTETAFRESRN